MQSASFGSGDKNMVLKKPLPSSLDSSPASSISATDLTSSGGNSDSDNNNRFNHERSQSLHILSPFDEQEEWNKISEIMASISGGLADGSDPLLPPFVDKELCGRQGKY
jgi:hypothetical protein